MTINQAEQALSGENHARFDSPRLARLAQLCAPRSSPQPAFSAGTRLQGTQMHHRYTHIQSHPHRWTQTQRALTQTQHEQLYLGPFSEQDRVHALKCGPLQQLGSDSHSAQQLPLDPSCWHWMLEPPRPQPYASSWYRVFQTHTHSLSYLCLPWSPIGNFSPPCGLRDTPPTFP